MLYNEFLNDAKLYSVNEIIIPILPENNIGKSIVSNLSNIYKVETEYIIIYDCSVNASDFGNSYYNAEHLNFNAKHSNYNINKSVHSESVLALRFIPDLNQNSTTISEPALNKDLNQNTNLTGKFLCLLGKVQIGKCKIEISDTNASLYEFEIFEEYRNKGYGSAFLSKVTDYLSGKGVEKILLQVSGANTSAYKMYMHHGFKIYSSLDIFTLFVR